MYKKFVALNYLSLNNCKQRREILAFPPNSYRVEAKGSMSLELYKKCWLPDIPIARAVCSGIVLEASFIRVCFHSLSLSLSLSHIQVWRHLESLKICHIREQENREKKGFNILVSVNKIPDWFRYGN
jgi:hypothetical protein